MNILRDETNERTDVSLYFRHPIPHYTVSVPPVLVVTVSVHQVREVIRMLIRWSRDWAFRSRCRGRMHLLGHLHSQHHRLPPSTPSIFSTLAGSSYDAGFGMIGSGVNGK
jgi:hypothetical protein